MRKFLFFIIFIIMGCMKDNYDFPHVNVAENLYINNPEYFDVQVPGGYIYLPGGVGGLLLYRKNLDEFLAYDRASTFNPIFECQVTVTNDNVTIEDPCSESEFLITDGSVIQGPANQPLMRYNTTYNGNYLTIFN